MSRIQTTLRVVVLMTVALWAPQAFAGGYWRFFVTVDGKPACTGGIGVFGPFEPLDHLELAVRQGGVQLGVDSFLDPATEGDITFTGDIIFRDQQHTPLHLSQLRLVYERDSASREGGATVAGGHYDWHLHPDDAELIVAHYRQADRVARRTGLAKKLGVAAAFVAVPAVLFFRWRRRRRAILAGSAA